MVFYLKPRRSLVPRPGAPPTSTPPPPPPPSDWVTCTLLTCCCRHLLPLVPSLFYTHVVRGSFAVRLWATLSHCEFRTVNAADFASFVSTSLHVSWIPTRAAGWAPAKVCWGASPSWAAPGWNGRLMLQAAALATLVSIRFTKQHCKFNFAWQFLPALLLRPLYCARLSCFISLIPT